MVRFRESRSAAELRWKNSACSEAGACLEAGGPVGTAAASAAAPCPRFAVLIPAYNHAQTLVDVISRALRQSRFVLVVDDGSTDDSAQRLARFERQIAWVRFRSNRGKGLALREGFSRLREYGFSHAVTLDADGQHFPEDIPGLIALSRRFPDAIVLGQREMRRAGAPWKSRVGLSLSNSLVRRLAGLSLADTQAGFRVYPLASLDALGLEGAGFDLEFEILVRAARQGVPILPLDIHCTYSPSGGRVSHFRPLRDTCRIGLRLLTVLLGTRPRPGQRPGDRSARALTR